MVNILDEIAKKDPADLRTLALGIRSQLTSYDVPAVVWLASQLAMVNVFKIDTNADAFNLTPEMMYFQSRFAQYLVEQLNLKSHNQQSMEKTNG